jgi:hypothetical protein
MLKTMRDIVRAFWTLSKRQPAFARVLVDHRQSRRY